MKTSKLLYSVAILAAIGLPTFASAETITTKTYVETKDLPNVNEIEFGVFDVNNDGAYSMTEVGERLFKSFDRDSNGHIDNIEWDKKTVMTITPIEKETFKFIDYNDDGYTDTSTYTYETFFKASGLIKFDKNQNGLSAEEFIGVGFETLDDDENKLIDIEEWKEAYIQTLPKHAKQKSYN